MESALTKRPAQFRPAPLGRSLRDECSEGEWETRCELAALARLTHHYGLDDMANGILAARVKDRPDRYIIHPYGIFWDEVTASDFVLIDTEGDLARPDDRYLGIGVFNVALWVFNNNLEASFLLHGHIEAIQAVSITESGLEPLCQAAVFLMPLIGYIEYDFLEDEVYSKNFIERALDHDILISRHHGYYTTGETAAEVFFRTYYLAQACRIQIQAKSMGGSLRPLPMDELMDFNEAMYDSDEYNYDGATEWLGWLRLLERRNPGWDN